MREQNTTILVMASIAVAAAFAAACSSGSSPSPNPACDSGDVSCMAFDSGSEASTSSSGSSSGSSSSSGGSEAASEAGEAGGSSGGDSDNEAGESDGGGEGGTTTSGEAGADGGCTMFEGEGNAGGMITVYNFDNWCTVSLNGAAANVSSSYQACVPIGNSAPIVVGPASTMFELGPTPFVRISGAEVPDGSSTIFSMGDGGFGSTSTVIVGITSAAACALVCCPFTDGTGCDSSFSGYSTFLQNCP
jgi:hypothetical protein